MVLSSTINSETSNRALGNTDNGLIELGGLSGHENLVSFLALMGTLRALDTAKPEWRSRALWKGTVPNLCTDMQVSKDEVVNAVVQGLQDICQKIDFCGKKVTDFSRFSELTNCGVDEDTATALMVENLDPAFWDKRKDERITPLYLRRGAGHLHFLDIARNLAVQKKNSTEIQRTLFGQWKYVLAEKMSFCWDINEYQPSARGSVSKDKKGSITSIGANMLALVGFTAYSCVPKAGRGRCATVGCSKNYNTNTDTVFWPLWKHPLSFFGITILLSHPRLREIVSRDPKTQKSRDSDLEPYGIESVMAADIFVSDRYRYVQPAKRIL